MCYDAAMNECALLFTGGRGPDSTFSRSLIPPCTFICAADSGIDTALMLGYHVDEAIGAFDSLSNKELLNTIPHKILPQEKDITDTEALLQHIQAKGYASYILVGGGEGRFDHLLHLYTLFAQYGPPLMWLTAREQLFLVRTFHEFTVSSHTAISIIPAMACGNSTVTSKNLYWELLEYPISMNQQSISNKCHKKTFSITVSGDPVFVSIPFP